MGTLKGNLWGSLWYARGREGSDALKHFTVRPLGTTLQTEASWTELRFCCTNFHSQLSTARVLGFLGYPGNCAPPPRGASGASQPQRAPGRAVTAPFCTSLRGCQASGTPDLPVVQRATKQMVEQGMGLVSSWWKGVPETHERSI